MVFLFSLSFIVAMFVAMLVIRGARGHAGRYGYAKPQRFHAGDVPRLGGLAIFAGLVWAWRLLWWLFMPTTRVSWASMAW